MKRVAFVGCRDWRDDATVRASMASVSWSIDDMVVVTGDASGADAIAATVAAELALKCVVHRADWDRLGRAAGPERNARIVADSDAVVAFWDGKSRGTLDCISQAVRAGKPVRIVPKVTR